MKSETVHKIIKVGALVKVHESNEVGLIIKSTRNWDYSPNNMCYVIFVKGKEVKAYGEGLTVIGEN